MLNISDIVSYFGKRICFWYNPYALFRSVVFLIQFLPMSSVNMPLFYQLSRIYMNVLSLQDRNYKLIYQTTRRRYFHEEYRLREQYTLCFPSVSS